MLRDEEVRNPGSCLNKAKPAEPIFVLRAQDELADVLVDEWADQAEANGVSAETVQGAREIAAQMRAWPNRKVPG